MANPFKTHIRAALADENLQSALDANYERRRNVRLQSYQSLPADLQTMRQRAHDIRADVVTHLDTYLEQFVKRVQENGITVHRAADATQAVAIVLEIARQHNVRLVAKAKTMVSEEIRLNEELEKAGLKVVETDLGEYIVQIRGEHPAHIITPAVHLRRADVGKTFHEKLGIPMTDDVTTLTQAAKQVLRQVFLDADMGISGVNMGVVENGALCLFTNEGNGRMVTTLPKVHVALMGIERLVPDFADLAVIMNLLPRSATGQKLTVYANLLYGPRRFGDPDGPDERHLVLLDNGRRAISQSPLQEALFCVRCGACLNTCPVFREIGGHAYVSLKGESSIYPGPIGSVLTPGIFGYREFGHLARACSLCGACYEACPVMTNLPDLMLKIKAGKTPAGQTPSNAPGYLKLGLSFFTWIATTPILYYYSQRLAGLFSRCMPAWLRLPAVTGWGYAKDFPRPAMRPFNARWKNLAPLSAARLSPDNHRDQSQLDGRETIQPETQAISISLHECFAQELTALYGQYIPCTAVNLAERILELLKEKDIVTLQAWEPEAFPAGLLEHLRSNGIQVVHQPDPHIRAGLTGALAAIAESGTILIAGGPGRPLSASLLPEIHLAILMSSDIYRSLPQVLELPEVQGAASAVLISGPSRTADIEMTMTLGMHGPGELHVFCLEDD